MSDKVKIGKLGYIPSDEHLSSSYADVKREVEEAFRRGEVHMSKHNRDRKKSRKSKKSKSLDGSTIFISDEDPATSNYLRKMEEQTRLALENGDIKEGCVYVNDIYHDDWCDLLNSSKGIFNCDPIVKPPRQVHP